MLGAGVPPGTGIPLPPDFRVPSTPNTYTPRPWTPPPSSASSGNIAVLVVTIIGVLIAAILLLGYYFFAPRCCFWRRRSDALDRSQRRLRDDLMMFAVESRGLGQSEIRQIPIFQYRKETDASGGGGDCAVCLGEFQDEETVRLLPDCFHVFHVDCIDTWLQSNANCPLCRASITPEAAAVPVDKLPAFVRSRGLQGTRSGDVAIDVRDDEPEADRRRQLRRHGSTGSRRPPPDAPPMRRSFSVDTAAADRRLYGEVQKIVWQNPHFREAATSIGEGSGGAGRIRWGLFPFHRRSSSAAAFS